MDTTTLCLIAIIVIAVLFLIPRLMGSARKVDYSQRGDESPRVDSPEIRSRGGFGGQNDEADAQAARGSERPRYDDRDVESRGGFGRDRPNETRDREEHDRGSSFGSHVGSQPPKRDFDDKGSGSTGLAGFADRMRDKDDDDTRRSSRPSGGRQDDPDVESRGGFGRDKD